MPGTSPPPRWALTPPFHPYLIPRLRGGHRRSVFCCAIPGLAPGGRYPPPDPVEPGLSSEVAPRGSPARTDDPSLAAPRPPAPLGRRAVRDFMRAVPPRRDPPPARRNRPAAPLEPPVPARATKTFDELTEIARQIRRDVVTMTHVANSGHAGGPLSAADYLTYLFFNELRLDPKTPTHPDRDRFILSNGHCSALLYAELAHRGFIPRTKLGTFRDTGTDLQGHPNRHYVPGIEVGTGSARPGPLDRRGHGAGAAPRTAEALRADGPPPRAARVGQRRRRRAPGGPVLGGLHGGRALRPRQPHAARRQERGADRRLDARRHVDRPAGRQVRGVRVERDRGVGPRLPRDPDRHPALEALQRPAVGGDLPDAHDARLPVVRVGAGLAREAALRPREAPRGRAARARVRGPGGGRRGDPGDRRPPGPPRGPAAGAPEGPLAVLGAHAPGARRRARGARAPTTPASSCSTPTWPSRR